MAKHRRAFFGWAVTRGGLNDRGLRLEPEARGPRVTEDEIVFGEMSVREPVRLRRPDRDARRACVAFGIPSADDLPVFLDYGPADLIERHALSDTSVELGGILLGKECVDDETGEPFVLITEALEAKHYENTQASFTYTHESWAEISRERDQKHPDLDIVGWYHTHPDFGIFLSGPDLFIHHNFFPQPLQVAYVVDPIRQKRGFFQWRDGGMAPVRGFFVSGERTQRIAISRVVNELENLPNPEGGGGLSPRLEAELIAMMSRPHTSHVIDRGSSALVFGLVGTILGALAVGVVFWLNTLSQQMQAQSRQLARLERSDTLAAPLQEERVAAKERALDTLLSEVKIGTPPESIRERYTEVIERNQELERRLAMMNTEKEALALHSDSMKKRVGELSGEVSQLLKDKEETEQDMLRRIELAQDESQRLKNDSVMRQGGQGEASLLRNANILLWAAIGGWLAFVFALAGVVVLWTRRPTAEPEAGYDPRIAVTPRKNPSASSEPHVIE